MSQVLINEKINTYRREDIQGYEALEELALNLLWSWNHNADKIWHRLDPALWEFTHNPWVVLQTVSREKLERMLADSEFRKEVDEMVKTYRHDAESPAWFQKTYPQSPLTCVAYFSMEFMLSEALPIYSGGLGNVAGDQLKASSDLGIPVVAIGLLYQQGYFRQIIDSNGAQQELYPYNDPGQLPITPLRKANGEWLRLEIALPGWSLWIRAWQVQVGRVKLYLLDSNDAANFPAHRGITSELYGGDSELRLKQELLLGMGGWRLLDALGIKPEVYHLNEGHAAFAVLARANSFMKETGCSFEVALAATRAGNIFTTHTAVPAGFDRFHPALIEQYFERYLQKQLGITLYDLLALGRENPDNPSEYFNMAYFAVRGSGFVNGVSRLHGKVSQHIFEPLFPRWPEKEIPISYVTNGVHMPSWDSANSDNLWTESCGKCRWLEKTDNLEKEIRQISAEKIWQMRNNNRKSLVEFARARFTRQMEIRGATRDDLERSRHFFDPNALTLGFARRFATYKRPNMLLHDPARLIRILTNPERPVQLIIAGKAHPADNPGKAMIQEWIHFIKRPDVRGHVMFLSDYDVLLTEHLVQGVDVWINTPRRPWEASGTSGMKVLVNGGINLSELDGWWEEAYKPELGWALGDGKEHGEDPEYDIVEANALYDLIEQEVIPEFYTRDKDGIPTKWINRIRESMAQLTPHFSSNRTVREYTDQHYTAAAANYRQRAANNASQSVQIVAWKHNLKQNWDSLKFGEVKVETNGDQYAFEVKVYLNDLDPDAIKVELYVSGLDGTDMKYEMKRVRKMTEAINTYVYNISVPKKFPAEYYTPRIVPYHPGVAVPLEASQILWQR
jgi:glycogen phosphorylase